MKRIFLIVLALAFAPQLTFAGSQTFTSSGTFVVPAYTSLTVQVWGPGGGGGGSLSGYSYGGSGGGGGGYSTRTYSSGQLTQGSSQSVVVASGGVGGYGNGYSAGPGSSGGQSSFAGALFATSGTGGGPAGCCGGSGGSASGGATNSSGTNGRNGSPNGGAGSGGSSPNAPNGYGYGGLGSSGPYAGSPGGPGIVVVTWTSPASCTFNSSTVAHGASVTAYQASTVAYGSSCVSQTRTCNNGSLSGSYQYSSCTVSPQPLQCTGASEIYATSGTYTRAIPTYNTMVVETWGGGASGGPTSGSNSNPGTQSSFNGSVLAGGGYGTSGYSGGAGGSASLGDTNTAGGSGGSGHSVDLCAFVQTTSGAGGSSPNGGSGGSGVGGSTAGNAGSAPGGGGSGTSAQVWNPQAGGTFYCYRGAGGGAGAYSKKTYSSGTLTPGSSVAIVVGSGGASVSNSGAGAVGQVKITCSQTPPIAPPTATLTVPQSAYVGQPFTVSSTFTAGAGDTLQEDNIDSPLGTGLGANTFASSPKSISYSTSSAGTVTFYARALTSSYAWATYDTKSVTVTLPATPTATLSVNSGTHYANQPLTITATFSTSTGDTLLEDNVDSPLGTGLGANTNPSLTKIISYTPSAPGTYTFYARARSSAYSAWATYQTLDVVVVASCTPSSVYSCSGSNIVQTNTNAQCAVTTNNNYASCSSPTFCSAGSSTCINPTPTFSPSGNLTGHLQIFPNIVAYNNPTTLYWNISNVSSCSATGSNGNGPWSSAPHDTSPILARTTYTLDCMKLNGDHLIESAVVNVAPVFNEK